MRLEMMLVLRGVASPPSIARPLPGEAMNDGNDNSGSWLSLVLRDPQFWVPVAVLIAGLFVLRWIS